MMDFSGNWTVEGHPIKEDGTKGKGVHRFELKQNGDEVEGVSYYLIDPQTGEENPNKEDSLSKLKGRVFEKEYQVIEVVRYKNDGTFIAVFTGVYKDGKVSGYFVNTKGRGGDFTMVKE